MQARHLPRFRPARWRNQQPYSNRGGPAAQRPRGHGMRSSKGAWGPNLKRTMQWEGQLQCYRPQGQLSMEQLRDPSCQAAQRRRAARAASVAAPDRAAGREPSLWDGGHPGALAEDRTSGLRMPRPVRYRHACCRCVPLRDPWAPGRRCGHKGLPQTPVQAPASRCDPSRYTHLAQAARKWDTTRG